MTDITIDKDELVELLILCLKSQGFMDNSSERRAKLIADFISPVMMENRENVKSILERVGKALIDASNTIT